MKRSFKVVLSILLALAVIALTAFYVSNHSIPVLEPKGIIGEKERNLIITSSLLMLIVVVPVFILAWAFAWKYRAHKKSRHEPDWEHNYIAEYCWWGVPLVIIVVLAVICVKSSYELSPFKPIESDKKALTIQAVALNWKWLFIYPEQGIATINFVQFPEKTPLNFEISSDAPMNSFWIPQLGGQIYAMPGMRSKLYLMANEPGTFRGCSANISGEGFAGMKFAAKASTEAEFDAWVQMVKTSGAELTDEGYNKLVEPSQYQPVSYYNLKNMHLFDQILMKYMTP